jgi:serine/threonine protein kinase
MSHCIDGGALEIAREWCLERGPGWFVMAPLGEGATASVFELGSPEGPRSLKIYNPQYSSGKQQEIGLKRIEQQVALIGDHQCPSLVKIYDGGVFEERLFILMSRAPGTELERCLMEVPRNRIRGIVSQVARAVLFLETKGQCHRDIKVANVFISNDFNQATLLDLSVIRDIYDPFGAGTDQDGQLPVVATTRYTSPEYLFRLLESGPDLWHALNIYQLGALLHDLIMREPLFEIEYQKSAENRYRFAWIVAMTIPQIQAEDVDKDLIFIAQRALDKDWNRRSTLRLEDFLDESPVLERHALTLVGLMSQPELRVQSDSLADRFERVSDISNRLEADFLLYLGKHKVTPIHRVMRGASDTSKHVTFEWTVDATEVDPIPQKFEFRLTINLLVKAGKYHFALTAELSRSRNEEEQIARLELPEFVDDVGVESALASQSEVAFTKLAVEITRPEFSNGEA